MNTFKGIGIYKGETFTDSGLRFMHIDLPKVGNKGNDVPIYVVPNKAAGETFDAFSPGLRLLLNGRLYPSRQDYKMYFVPNSPLQVVTTNLTLNSVNLAGGYVSPEYRDNIELLKFTLMCSAPAQPILNHTWDDSLSFRIEAWGDDAKRIQMLGHKGRQMTMEGILRYSTWKTAEGETRGGYSVRTRAGLYQFFGKKKTENTERKPSDEPVYIELPEGTNLTKRPMNEPSKHVIAEPYQSTVKESVTIKPAADEGLPF